MSSVKELEINNTVYDIKGKTVVDNNSGELSFWSGSKAQYDDIVTKDSNTLYNITDDTDVSLTILEALYPVGSIYITTNVACPLSTLIAGSTWVLVGQDRVLQGAGTRGVVGTTLNESLPNITGSTVSGLQYPSSFSGALYDLGNAGSKAPNADSSGTSLGFDASRSSSTYQDDAPVQQEAVQYPYFIQVATGVETSVDVSREIELNNPFSLLDYKFSEYELSNASWLLSNGQYNSGATYSAVYNLLLQIYNGTVTKDGVSVKLSTEAYTDTDFVLNTGDTTFRLPTKVALASGKAVAGNGMTLGLTNGTYDFGMITNQSSTDNKYLFMVDAYGTNVGSLHNATPVNSPNAATYGITTDETKSGIETSANGLYLYFYVGETIQDANIIAAASVLTDVADLKAHSIVETYVNGTSWYRIYSDSWCEQGGQATSTSVTYLKEFTDTNYNLQMTYKVNTSQMYGQDHPSTKTTSGFTCGTEFINGFWYACGYIS